MILALDIGNTTIYGGVFDQENLRVQFRKNSKSGCSSDELGLFLKGVLRENGIDPSSIHKITLCSVVPDIVPTLKNCCKRYFDKSPFILQAGAKTGMKIKYHNPLEVGSDRIANAIAATHLYPTKDLIVVDFGTAITFCAVNLEKEYLGGAIFPGLRIAMEALESNTAKLPAVEIVASQHAVGRSTVESIQSGLYFGSIGAVKELCVQIQKEAFSNRPPIVIGTGGFASMFSQSQIFDIEISDLVLKGLVLALKLNT